MSNAFDLFAPGIPNTGGETAHFAETLTGQTGMEAATAAGALQSTAITDASKLAAASQEEIRKLIEQQLGITREQFAPFLAAGTGALPGVQQSSTIGGLDQRIAQILGADSFQPLLEERTRSVEGMLGAGGLVRSGSAITEAAKIPTDLAFEIENMLSGRETDLANIGVSAASQGSSQEEALLKGIVDSITQGTGALTSGLTGAASASASGILGGAESEAAGAQNMLNVGGILAAVFSDPRLKENIVKIGNIGPLNVYSWDYINEVKGMARASMESGFMSNEVKAIYPEHIHEIGGFDLIDYKSVINELEKDLN